MKKKDLHDLRKKPGKELSLLLKKKHLKLIRTRVDRTAGKNTGLKKEKNLKLDIAQILTIIREKEILKDIEEEN